MLDVISAILAGTLAHSLASNWTTWVIVASVGLARLLVELLDRREANARRVRTYVRADGGDPPR